MLQSIDRIRSVDIEGIHYRIKNIIPNGDPLNQFCPTCGDKNKFYIDCELSQLGMFADVHVILCTCKSCLAKCGWRYFMTPDEVI